MVPTVLELRVKITRVGDEHTPSQIWTLEELTTTLVS